MQTSKTSLSDVNFGTGEFDSNGERIELEIKDDAGNTYDFDREAIKCADGSFDIKQLGRNEYLQPPGLIYKLRILH